MTRAFAMRSDGFVLVSGSGIEPVAPVSQQRSVQGFRECQVRGIARHVAKCKEMPFIGPCALDGQPTPPNRGGESVPRQVNGEDASCTGHVADAQNPIVCLHAASTDR